MKSKKSLIRHSVFLQWVHYNPNTGVFMWLLSRGCCRAGTRAGRLHHSGYRDLHFMGYRTNEARWAVFYMTGKWPEDQVDHKKVGKEYRADNRYKSIRVATRSQNFANRHVQSNSRSGVKGVRQLSSGRWAARTGPDQKHLGTFDTREQAGAAVAIEAQKRYGEFARLN